MGYTRYWKRTEEKITDDFIKEVNKIIKEAARLGIAIRGWDGKGNPVLTNERISFNGNGNAEYDLSHESFVLDEEIGFNFCKTARKPYDYVVRNVLQLAWEHGLVEEVSDDGMNERIISDEQYLQEYFDMERN